METETSPPKAAPQPVINGLTGGTGFFSISLVFVGVRSWQDTLAFEDSIDLHCIGMFHTHFPSCYPPRQPPDCDLHVESTSNKKARRGVLPLEELRSQRNHFQSGRGRLSGAPESNWLNGGGDSRHMLCLIRKLGLLALGSILKNMVKDLTDTLYGGRDYKYSGIVTPRIGRKDKKTLSSRIVTE